MSVVLARDLGDLLRDGAGVLPTGRNMHALDPVSGVPVLGRMTRAFGGHAFGVTAVAVSGDCRFRDSMLCVCANEGSVSR